jgi:hypothetical protein
MRLELTSAQSPTGQHSELEINKVDTLLYKP